ncbi:restriction endonuclease subunit S [Dehalobacter sp. TBBPA1]|uniref:restriction endonuclease subunit S n=1 Tax=Dehalobacter sp. TBBPA1 TaxID=3235037 RepID=UPI0034A4C4B1
MSKWEKVKIGDVSPIVASSVNIPNEKVWLLNLDVVQSNSGAVLEYVFVNQKEIGNSTIKFDTENVLYSKLRPYLNKVVMPDQAGYATSEMLPLRPNPRLLSREYLTHYLRSCVFVSHISEKVAGAKMPRVVTKEFKESLIPLPPLETQKQIAKTLDTVSELLSMRKQQLAELDGLIKAVFYDMFGDPVRNSLHQKLVKLKSLIKNKNDLVDGPFGSSVNTKVDYVSDGEIPVIRTKNVSNLEFVTEDLKFMKREKYETVIRSQVLPNDIVLTKVGTIGNLCIFPEKFSEAVLSTTGSCRIRVNKEIVDTKFLLYYLHFYKPKMLEIASAGVQAFLNMNHIKEFDIFEIPIGVQTQFATIVTKIEEQKALVKKAIDETQYNLDSLMSQYFD